jgi:hypothetical protein
MAPSRTGRRPPGGVGKREYLQLGGNASSARTVYCGLLLGATLALTSYPVHIFRHPLQLFLA